MATLAVCACPSRRPLIDLRSTGSIDSHQRSRSPRSMSRLRSCRQRPIVALHPLERRRARMGWSEKKLPTLRPCCPFRRQDARAGQFSQYVMRQERRSDQRSLISGSQVRALVGIGILQRLSSKARYWRGFSSPLKLIPVSVRGSVSTLSLRSKNSRSWRGSDCSR